MRDTAGLHKHKHEHRDGTVHAHEHHHGLVRDPSFRVHDHPHPLEFNTLAHIASPLSTLDARAKLLAALVFIVAVVVSPPLRPVEAALVSVALIGCALIGRLPLKRVLARSSAVLAFAAPIALLAPLQAGGGSLNVGGLLGPAAASGWVAAWGIVSKAWVSAFVMTLVVATTEVPELLTGLRLLGVPEVLTMLFAFITRYAIVLREELHSMRVAMASRAPFVDRGRLVRLYGHLAGAMVLRAYDRGERIYAAMVSRGFDGSLPVRLAPRFGVAEALAILCAALMAAAVILY